jgi:hypothetical protein
MFILLLVMTTYGSDDDEHGFESRTDYGKLKLILPIEDVSKEDIRKILVKKQWIILEYPLEYPLQRINYSKKDSFEMLSYLFDENKIRLSQLGYELSKLGEYEEDCYTLIFINDDLLKKKENPENIPSKEEIQNRIIKQQWDTIKYIVNKNGAPRKLQIEPIYEDTLIPLDKVNSGRLKSIYGYTLNSYQIGSKWFYEFIYKED